MSHTLLICYTNVAKTSLSERSLNWLLCHLLCITYNAIITLEGVLPAITDEIKIRCGMLYILLCKPDTHLCILLQKRIGIVGTVATI